MANDNDMRRMQQEAIQRVNEMQNRARRHLQEAPSPEPPEEQPAAGQEEAMPSDQPAQPDGTAARPQATLFDGLMRDSERTLILLLILLLFTEKADTSVIFSLLYLIL